MIIKRRKKGFSIYIKVYLDLQVEQSNIVSTLEPVFESNSDIVETIKVCANVMCNHAVRTRDDKFKERLADF